MDGVRWDRVNEVRWRVKNGFYGMPEVVAEVVLRLFDENHVLEVTGRATCQDDPDLDCVDNTVPPG